ncbi:MAG: hypothetical protein HC883_01340 [Bdellovibrionaceae bacterium]|nr:hypothetical protein [Pseudobdellovibrionaceae bacterium]
MGMHANDALDYACVTELLRLDYEEGRLSEANAYDMGIIDELGFSTESRLGPRSYAEEDLAAYTNHLLNLFGDF